MNIQDQINELVKKLDSGEYVIRSHFRKHYPDVAKYLDEKYPNIKSMSERLALDVVSIEERTCPNDNQYQYLGWTLKFTQFCGNKRECKCFGDNFSELMKDIHKNMSPERKLEIKDKRENTMIERIGTKTVFENPERLKQIQDDYEKKTGYRNPSQNPEIMAKRIETNIRRTGFEHGLQSPEIQEKRRQTLLNTTGFEYPMQNPETRAKAAQTYEERTGYDHPTRNPEVIAKREDDYEAKTGYRHATQNPEVKQKMANNYEAKTGFRNSSQNPDVQELKRKNYREKYGYDHPSQNPEVKEKRKETILNRFNGKFVSNQHMTDETIEIMNDINLLQEVVDKHGILQTAKLLGVRFSSVYRKQDQGLILPKLPGSTPERVLKELFEIHNLNFEMNNRKIIKPKELDFYFPDQKIAIEFCGLYWHSHAKLKNKNYHFNKMKECEQQGIRLFTIFEDEYNFHPEYWNNKILHKLGVPVREIIHEDDCEVIQLDNSLVRSFIEENHLYGIDNFTDNLALVKEDEIITVMTINEVDDKIILDFCSDPNVICEDAQEVLISCFDRSKDCFVVTDNRIVDNFRLGEFHQENDPETWFMTNYHKKFKTKISTKHNKKIYDCGYRIWKIT